MLTHDIPDEWHIIRNQLQERAGRSVILAGGALRDLDNEKPVKDLDFFVPVEDFDDWALINRDILHQEGWFRDWAEANLYDTYGAMCNPEVKAISCYKVDGFDKRINIIGLELDDFNVYTVANRMDMGLCRIAYDGNTTYASADYWFDKTHQRMTCFYVGERALARSKRRFLRLKPKYPDFGFIVEHEGPLIQ